MSEDSEREDHQEQVVEIGISGHIGEGFDDARLDTLFLALPISWRGTLQQYAGRLHRLHDNEREVRVYDFVDRKVPVLGIAGLIYKLHLQSRFPVNRGVKRIFDLL